LAWLAPGLVLHGHARIDGTPPDAARETGPMLRLMASDQMRPGAEMELQVGAKWQSSGKSCYSGL
jgi:hypothetical protein